MDHRRLIEHHRRPDTHIDARRNKRVPLCCGAWIRRHNGAIASAVARDLSPDGGGMRLAWADAFHLGEQVEVAFDHPDFDTAPWLRARVCWQRHDRIGFEFVDGDRRQRAVLARLIALAVRAEGAEGDAPDAGDEGGDDDEEAQDGGEPS